MASPSSLVVDLDGTLLRSDMLHETFWSAAAADWRVPLHAASVLARQGKAALKRWLSETGTIDVAALPYDAQVLDYIRAWRAKGGQVALVTASDQALAEAVAAHLGVFDTVHGSDGQTNLKGPAKAAFLVARYGEGQFAYMGDAPADLAVWAVAGQAITVNASRALRQKAQELCPAIEHLQTRDAGFEPYLKALRPHQWLKNTLVFLPILASHQITMLTLWQSLLAFIAFSLVASSVYVLNDLFDLKSDRAHPRKRNRPLASGAVPIVHSPWLVAVPLGLGFVIALALGGAFLLIMALYYAVTLAYSMDLKRRAIIDICVLAGLYTIRVVAGGAATDITVSIWLFAFSVFLFLSLACVKRQAELTLNAKSGASQIAGRGYTTEDRPIITMMAIAAGYLSVLVLALYLNSVAVRPLYAEPMFLWGGCCVLLYWVSRNVLIAHRGQMHDDPIIFAVKDRSSQVSGLIIAALVVAGILA